MIFSLIENQSINKPVDILIGFGVLFLFSMMLILAIKEVKEWRKPYRKQSELQARLRRRYDSTSLMGVSTAGTSSEKPIKADEFFKGKLACPLDGDILVKIYLDRYYCPTCKHDWLIHPFKNTKK